MNAPDRETSHTVGKGQHKLWFSVVAKFTAGVFGVHTGGRMRTLACICPLLHAYAHSVTKNYRWIGGVVDLALSIKRELGG